MTPAEQELLLTTLAGFSANPLGFVLWSYPWGEPSGELSDYPDGPEPWQRDILTDLGRGIITVVEAIAQAHASIDTDPILLARASGHGIGKSALVSWVMDWALATKVDTKGIVTANTENQLKTKTWAEMAKWHRMSLTKTLFRMTATARFSIDPDHEKTWRLDMVPWSEKNMEAFAGLHNKGKRILIVFDEASAIADTIWETTEGALTDKDTEIIWAVFGNPTKNSGRFRECFNNGKFAHRWNAATIDSREVSITNKGQIQKWIDDYGEDHDFVRVRVKGTFPRTDATSFIPLELAEAAAARPLPAENLGSVVLGVDVARFGTDASIIYPRRGRDARTLRPRVFHKLDTMQLATQVYNTFLELNATAIFVDGGGVGGGVVDRLNQLGVPVYEVTFSARSDNNNVEDPMAKYLNKRAEIWGALRSWLKHGCIPTSVPLVETEFPEELAGPSYTYSRGDYLQLEAKRDLARRGLASPDLSDALALTLAYPSLEGPSTAPGQQSASTTYVDSNPYEGMHL